MQHETAQYQKALDAVSAAADVVVDLQDTVAAYISRGETVPESLQQELVDASQALDDAQHDLDQLPIPLD